MKEIKLFLLTIFLGTPFTWAKMTYLSQVEDNRVVVLANDDGSEGRVVSPQDKHAYHPEISSDGRYLAYSVGTILPNRKIDVAIHVKDLQTGDIEVWTPSGNQYIHAEFSGDGEYLAFSMPVEREGKKIQNIALVNLKEERKKRAKKVKAIDGVKHRFYSPDLEIIQSKYHSYFPAIASDGAFVIYHRTKDVSSKSTPKEVVLYDRWSKETTLLTAPNGHGMVPSLSSDNRHIAYTGILNGVWDIHLIDRWTKEITQITHSPDKEFTPVFAPDGSISYSHITEKEDLFEIDIYKISKEDVFGHRGKVIPRPLINEVGVFEYVPSFSGDLSIELRQYSDIPNPARSSFATVKKGQKIYVIGGHQGKEHTYPPESFLKRLDIYDITTGTWSQAASMNFAKHGFQAVVHGRYIYTFGGFAFSANHKPGWKSLDVVERYDVEKNKWTVLKTRLPRRRSSNVSIKMRNKVYLLGGWNSTPKHEGDFNGKFHQEIDVFDLNNETVEVLKEKLPQPLRRALTGVTVGDEIILLGGISEGGSHFKWLDHVTAFNVKNNVWKEYPKLPFKTFAPGAGVANGRLFLLGGMNEQFEYLNTIYSFDLQKKKEWVNTGRYLKENKGFPQVINLDKDSLGILGGHTYIFEDDGNVVDTPVSTFELLLVE